MVLFRTNRRLLLLERTKLKRGTPVSLFSNEILQMSTLSKKRRYTKVSIEQVAELYHAGYNFSQIAQELNVCRNTVRKKIREYVRETGIHIYVQAKPESGEYTVDNILELHQAGFTVKEIAMNSGFTPSYIYKVLKRYRG